MPDKMSQEKISLLRAYGAEVIITPTAVPRESPESYYSVADRLADEIPGAFQPNQYFNQENPPTHYDTTGPEIWEQTDGDDRRLRRRRRHRRHDHRRRPLPEGSQNPDVVVVGADTEGSVYTGDEPRPYLTEGIGEDFFPETFDPAVVDRWVRVADRDAFLTARAVTRQEGILVGGSCGIGGVRGARGRARLSTTTTTIVVLLPDTGRELPLEALLRRAGCGSTGSSKRPEVVTRRSRCSSSKGAELPPLDHGRRARQGAPGRRRAAGEHGISQAPVVREESADVSQFVGSIRDRELLERVFRDPDALQADVAEVMAPPIPIVEWDQPIESAFAELEQAPAVLVAKAGQVLGVLTRSDLLDFLAHRRQAQR